MTTPAAAFTGVSFLLQVLDPGVAGSYRTVGGCKSNSGAIANAQLNTSSKDGDRWETMITGGLQKFTLSGSGVFKDDAVMAYIHSLAFANLAATYRLISANGDIYQGSFFIKTYQRQGSDASPEDFSFSLESAGTITYTAPIPTVTAYLPVTDVAAGGVAVAITGTKFQAGATVKFGTTPATSVVVVDQNHITCVAPAHSAATVAINVTNPDAQVATIAGFIFT